MAKKSSLTKVNTRQRVFCDSDGNISVRAVTMYLDSRGEATFVFEVPDYIVQALGVPDIVSAFKAEDAQRDFEHLMRRYQQHVKTARAEPVIILKIGYHALGADGRRLDHDSEAFFDRDFDSHREIRVSYSLAFRVNGGIYERKVETTHRGEWPNWESIEKESVGGKISYPRGVILDYTPELHRTLDGIGAALDGAARVLHGIAKAKDQAAALLALGNGTNLLGHDKAETKGQK